VYDCSFVRYSELCAPEVRVFEPILRRAIRRGVTLHTTSEFVANEIDEIFGPNLRSSGRLFVVRLGVPALGDASRMPPVVSQRVGASKYVLAIGTLEPRKNLAHLVSAFGALAVSHPHLHLVIAGNDGPARPGIDAAIARLPAPVSERVVLTGPVSDAGRRALLESATVLAYPSIYEGFGLPVLEAMSVGVPVVAARAGAIPEIAGDAALLVESTDEAGLAASITRLIDDDATRADLIERGSRRVRQFSWQDTARGLAECYARLGGASVAGERQ
jgi:alpha-1,3-rhamnosyl/mannosyltransferase